MSKALVPNIKASPKIPAMENLPTDYLLILVAKGYAKDAVTGRKLRDATHARSRSKKSQSTSIEPVTATAAGKLIVWAEWDPDSTAFQQQTAVRKAFELLLKETPRELAVVIHGERSVVDQCGSVAVYVAAVNSQFGLGKVSGKKVDGPTALQVLHLFGTSDSFSAATSQAAAEGNLLTRSLTLRPPNDLTPARYRAEISKLATAERWKHKEYGFKALKKMGAGAFCAVAQGSPHQDAAIVHLSYSPKRRAKGMMAVSLVGKGICMDTGGHGLKSAKGMYGMHEDMNGSAVALGILKAASDLQLPLAIDVWLAIAENHIGPNAYQPGDVVTALDGTTIEVVHTDAEGRMVLADTLTLASRAKPDLILDFATLTGAMVYSLGTRMAGVFSNRDQFAQQSVERGVAAGERVVAFPLEADYDAALDSKLADVKQCLIAGEADAIYAARFLSRFVANTPWIHMDLSAHRNEGGLGAVSDDVTGFGVAWGLAMLEKCAGSASVRSH